MVSAEALWKDNLQRLGEFIKAQRQINQLSQRELARLSDLSDTYMSQIERGLHEPSIRVLRALAESLGIQPNQLINYAAGLPVDGVDERPPVRVEDAIRADARFEHGPEAGAPRRRPQLSRRERAAVTGRWTRHGRPVVITGRPSPRVREVGGSTWPGSGEVATWRADVGPNVDEVEGELLVGGDALGLERLGLLDQVVDVGATSAGSGVGSHDGSSTLPKAAATSRLKARTCSWSGGDGLEGGLIDRADGVGQRLHNESPFTTRIDRCAHFSTHPRCRQLGLDESAGPVDHRGALDNPPGGGVRVSRGSERRRGRRRGCRRGRCGCHER